MEKIIISKKFKRINFLKKNMIICFVNVEIDPGYGIIILDRTVPSFWFHDWFPCVQFSSMSSGFVFIL
jgi:hypothetical protein